MTKHLLFLGLVVGCCFLCQPNLISQTTKEEGKNTKTDSKESGTAKMNASPFNKAMQEIMASFKTSPGCLGFEAGSFQSGKLVIFAWFKDKKSIMEWYKSTAHQNAIALMDPDHDKDHVAMKDIPEDMGPIMAVASAKPGKKDEKTKEAASFSLGIELYAPLPGGFRFGDSFAPASLKDAMKKKKADK